MTLNLVLLLIPFIAWMINIKRSYVLNDLNLSVASAPAPTIELNSALHEEWSNQLDRNVAVARIHLYPFFTEDIAREHWYGIIDSLILCSPDCFRILGFFVNPAGMVEIDCLNGPDYNVNFIYLSF